MGELEYATVWGLATVVADSLEKGDFSPEVALVTGDAFLEALHGLALRSLENAAVAGKLAWIVRDEGGLVLGSRDDEIEDRLVEIEDVRDYRKEP